MSCLSGTPTEPLRLTWIQPEDLIGHELRQAAQEGRDVSWAEERWLAAGGHLAPARAGVSPANPATGSALRQLALQLLDELSPFTPSPGLPTSPNATPPTHLAPGFPTHPNNELSPSTPTPEPPTNPDPTPPTHPTPALPTRPAPGLPSRPDAASSTHPDPELPTHPGFDHSARPAFEDRGRRPIRGLGAKPQASQNFGKGRGGEEDLQHRLHASWLGRAAGCLLGKPVEKLPLQGIRQIAQATGNWPLTTYFTARGLPDELHTTYPWNRRSATTSLAENIDGMPEDDDLNYPLLNLLLLQRHGRHFRTTDVAKLWLDELPAGRTFTAERIAYRNLLQGLEPPHTARHHNPFREWIGALIRADIHGWTNPGAPAEAAEQAARDAELTHTANGVYGAMFAAAAIAEAATGSADVHQALQAGLAEIPPDSRLARAIRHAIQLAGQHRDFTTVVDVLHETHGDYHWVHVIPNAALLAAALTHADGDFSGSLTRAVSGGWDTDSNGATAGSLAGLLAGHPDALGEQWTAPLKNRLATSVADFDGIGFDTLAQLTLREALRP
ncbi:ADP-ribosylglycohydrolase family protein [Streptomyces sp. NBC_01304]|uniref:ADP-ribosylglycohydrolase family protein n=1 Tax=Streptomyces sp. NBC_01304 TaxID=2903818 RepID=UPI002E11E83B|nr:ADP-ribosylglycohydrolase family protein [Streptomyces sp. NBC_01304]